MRATIDSTGQLTIVPENEIEAYALRCYQEKFGSESPPNICFQWDQINTPGNVKMAKGSDKPGQYFPFAKGEWEEVAKLSNPQEVKP